MGRAGAAPSCSCLIRSEKGAVVAKEVQAGELTKEQLRALADRQWGVVKELQVKLKAIKE